MKIPGKKLSELTEIEFQNLLNSKCPAGFNFEELHAIVEKQLANDHAAFDGPTFAPFNPSNESFVRICIIDAICRDEISTKKISDLKKWIGRVIKQLEARGYNDVKMLTKEAIADFLIDND